MMTIGVVGRKLGMTRIFTEEGVSEAVTVIHVIPNRVSQVKTMETDGYEAIQLTAGTKKASRVNKPMAGHFAKASIDAGDMLCEFKVENLESYTLGKVIPVEECFKVGQYVDVSSVTRGKGFTGVVKRHNFRTQDATHGNSVSHRVPGSIGQNQTPGRVFKGKKMAGHDGNKRVTIQNLQVIRLDSEKQVILIKGGIPGAPGAMVEIRPAVKMKAEDK
jgi:large subunit ribosomal protein L3